MRTIITLTMMFTATVVEAAPVNLSCSGVIMNKFTTNNRQDKEEKLYSIVVDLDKNSVMVNDSLYDITTITDSTLTVKRTTDLVIYLNRLTGSFSLYQVVHLHKDDDLIQTFDGICKLAQKLF